MVGFLIYYQRPVDPLEVLWFPVIVLVQLIFTIGLALFLSAMTVHFRDLKDLLGNVVQLWFFATPIIYPMHLAPPNMAWLLNLNPMTHIMRSYQQVLFFDGAARPPEVRWPRRRCCRSACSSPAILCSTGYVIHLPKKSKCVTEHGTRTRTRLCPENFRVSVLCVPCDVVR